MTRAQIADCANEEARGSRRRGAPRLEEDSSLSTLLDWLAWNDPNGEWDPGDDFGPAEAWEAIYDALT